MKILEPGSRVGIFGTSGEGKSRFFRWIVGLEERPEWEAAHLLDELPRSPEDWRRFRREVQLVPQRIATPPLSVSEFVEESESFASADAGREKFLLPAELESLGLPSDAAFLARPIPRLSGGELARVALLRALRTGPRFLLLDELTASLDEASVRRVESRLLRWWNERPAERGWVLCSHDPAQLRRLCETRYRLEGMSFHGLT